eukprot:11179416-Alexandrium_andersonii.AAC.1
MSGAQCWAWGGTPKEGAWDSEETFRPCASRLDGANGGSSCHHFPGLATDDKLGHRNNRTMGHGDV